MAGGFADLYFDVLRLHATRRRHRLAAFGAEARGFWHGARPLEGVGARRMLVPTRVLVVAARLVASHLHDAEHAAHLDRAERTFAAHHSRRVVGDGHLHVGHVGHAALAHRHVVGDQLVDLAHDAAVLDADHGGHVVAHRVHRVVAVVAVEA